MIGKIFITRTGYDPQVGRHVKDPYLGANPTLGACRPDFRRQLKRGDYVFTISGKVPGVLQYVMGGFEVADKVHANEAYRIFPDQRLHLLRDGQLDGNVIVDSRGRQHRLDGHSNFTKRLENYVIGTKPMVLTSSAEIEQARRETIAVLCETLNQTGKTPHEVITRFGRTLTEDQVHKLLAWLRQVKRLAA